ncbi:hypothetical protein GEV33_013800 [Tenebrio molitor]|uniref:Ig-like domain-containing protein n=1 Tax=Tenebrio molitor TaxID=7067 RepID=A0A8J6H6W5_TENMO|nr:hypothetical protein GEV33_013800 [Tenebrio molitor]
MKHISMEYHKLGERTPRVMADGNATAVDYARNLSQKSKNIYPDYGINKDSSKKLYQIALGYDGSEVYLWEEYIVADVRALRDMHIKVPEAVRVGDSVTLACNYDLESAALYTIKWYRYDSEFYRYVPKESPPSRVFVMPHLTVDISSVPARAGIEPIFHTDITPARGLSLQ